MRTILSIFIFLSVYLHAQPILVFSSFSDTVPVPSVGVLDTVMVPLPMSASYGLSEVRINMQHDIPYQISASLVHGTDTVVLFYKQTLLSDWVENVISCRFYMLEEPIFLASPPYSGLYSPMQNLGEFNDGDPNGEWRLIIEDHPPDTITPSGSLISWALVFEETFFLPATQQHSDASSPAMVCNDGGLISGASNGAGVQDDSLLMSLGCIGSEDDSYWMTFNVVLDGDLWFTIHSATDNDFAIWRTDSMAGPLRCSSAIDYGETGLDSSSTINADTLIFLPSLFVQSGEQYLVLINNKGLFWGPGPYDGSGMPFYLEWFGDAVLSCDTIPMPVPETDKVPADIVAVGNGDIVLSLVGTSFVCVSDMLGRIVMSCATMDGTQRIHVAPNQTYVVMVNGVGRKLFVY